MSACTVETVVHAEDWAAAGLDPSVLEKAARAALEQAGTAGEMALVLAGDEEMRALNATWRGKDTATNVLSFPMGRGRAPGGDAHLGDVVLAFGTVAREARERGIPIQQHAAHLVVHGVLHLLGHDHCGETQAVAMEVLETEILTGLGWPDPHTDGGAAKKIFADA